MAGSAQRRFTCPLAVTHPGTNLARRGATSLVETKRVTTKPNRQPIFCVDCRVSVIIIVSLCTRVLRVGFMTSLIVFSSEFTIEFYRIFVVDFLLHISRASASVEQEAQRSQRGRAMLRASDYFARSLEALKDDE